MESLTFLKKRKQNKLVIAHLNINSLKTNFDSLVEKMTGNVDIFVIFETKLNKRLLDRTLQHALDA